MQLPPQPPAAESGIYRQATAVSFKHDINATGSPSYSKHLKPSATDGHSMQVHLPAALPHTPAANCSPNMLSLGVLSALEAVRQTWLKEEEVKLLGAADHVQNQAAVCIHH